MRVAREAWSIGKDSILGFINDNALSHGAAMAFYAVTSLAPILLIVVAIAGSSGMTQLKSPCQPKLQA
jgi:membrane protein